MLLNLVAGVVCIVWKAAAPSGDDFSPYTIGKTLFTDVLEALDARHTAIKHLGSDKTKWGKRQEGVKNEFVNLFSPLPPTNRSKQPHVIERGTLTGDGFVMHKLLIEVRPGHYTTCGLWLPALPNHELELANKIPAILVPSGHDGAAWRDGSTQIIAYNFVKRGIAVLG